MTKNGTPVAAQPPGQGLVLGHLTRVVITVEDPVDLGLVQPDLDGQGRERCVIEDGGLLGEVGAVQPFRQFRLPLAGLGQVQQSVRVAGVAAAQPIHPERQPVRGRALLHLPLRVGGLRDGHAVLAGQQVDGRRADVRRRGQVEFE